MKISFFIPTVLQLWTAIPVGLGNEMRLGERSARMTPFSVKMKKEILHVVDRRELDSTRTPCVTFRTQPYANQACGANAAWRALAIASLIAVAIITTSGACIGATFGEVSSKVK